MLKDDINIVYQGVRKTARICIHTKRRGIHEYLADHTALPGFQIL